MKKLDRRECLAIGASWLAWRGAYGRLGGASHLGGADREHPLDLLLKAHADVRPEVAGAGANHYPMAAEALEAMGYEEAIQDSWREGAVGYAGDLPRVEEIEDPEAAIGSYARYGDWLDYFRRTLEHDSWRSVIGVWAPRLSAGVSGALFHGVIRTGHAARALHLRETDARRNELAAGLAYWAARYTELPTRQAESDGKKTLQETLEGLEHPWIQDVESVGFDFVMDRMTKSPIAPPVAIGPPESSALADLQVLVHTAASAFLEMLVLERHRIWLLHTVTGPAAVGLLLPHVDADAARKLAAHARQTVVAMYSAYGAPHRAGANVRSSPPPWKDLTMRAAESGSVHTIKLIDALARFDGGSGPLYRSVAAQWFEWT